MPTPVLQRGFGWIYACAAIPRPQTLAPDVLPAYFDVYADRDRLFGLGAIARELLRELGTLRLGRLLADCPVPVLQVWGKHDRLVPSRQARGRSGATVLRGCGHCPQLDVPDRLLDAVLPFLELPATAERSTARARLGGGMRAARS